jgi:hypothetical protein
LIVQTEAQRARLAKPGTDIQLANLRVAFVVSTARLHELRVFPRNVFGSINEGFVPTQGLTPSAGRPILGELETKLATTDDTRA